MVEGGDVIYLDDRVFEVIHMPGHSPSSMGLWEAASGLLFSGDAIYDGQLLDPLYHSDVPDYLETLERLRTLPARVVHGGHKASFGHERMVEIVDDFMAGKRARVSGGDWGKRLTALGVTPLPNQARWARLRLMTAWIFSEGLRS